MRCFTRASITGLVGVLSLAKSLAAPGELDLAFDPGALVSPPSNTQLTVQPDGKIILVGAFTALQETSRNRIARLNSDGSLDTSFLNALTGADGGVFCVALQTNSQILVGGDFSLVNNSPRARIARLNGDGTLDASFLNGMAGINDWVESIRVQDDGKILVAGYFTSVNGLTRNFLARLNADGSLDMSFLNNLGGANNPVFSLALQIDGKILAGGSFTNINGVARN